MNKYYLGVDLGSTTCKAIIINEKDEITGRGITNTRANYKIAADIARKEAVYDARFNLLEQNLKNEIIAHPEYKKYIEDIKSVFQYLQFKKRLDSLYKQLKISAETFSDKVKEDIKKQIDNIIDTIEPLIKKEFIDGDLGTKNQFFRDIISEKSLPEIWTPVPLREARCL